MSKKNVKPTFTVSEKKEDANISLRSFFKALPLAAVGLFIGERSEAGTWRKMGAIPSGTVLGPGSSGNNNVAVFDGTSGKIIKDGGKSLPAGSIVGTTDTQTLNNKSLSNLATVHFISQGVLSSTSGAITVDWSVSQNYLQTEPTGAITYTFTNPGGPCHLQMLIGSDGASTAQAITWPGSVSWYGATWVGANNKKAIINFWFDGTNYHAMGVNQV